MITDMHLHELADYIRTYLPGTPAFVFGSSLRKVHFRDVDVALLGSINRRQLGLLDEALEESDFPYRVDLVEFDAADAAFRTHISHTPIRWLTHPAHSPISAAPSKRSMPPSSRCHR